MVKLTQNILLRYLFIMFLGIGIILGAEYFGFFEGIDNYLYDLSFRSRGVKEHDRRIIIAAIDEKTLQKVGRWPFERRNYTDFLTVVSQANVVGFDIIMAEPSDDDTLCAEAFKTAGRVILPLYIDTQLHINYPVEAFSSCRTGHVHVEQGIDGIVRQVFHTIYIKDMMLPSFTSVLYEYVTGKPFAREAHIGLKNDKDYPEDIVQTDSMYINYSGPGGTFRQLSFSDILEGLYPQVYFRDKIILVGLTTAGIGDKMLTPFTEKRDRMAGVEVHANILNSMILQNNILMIPRTVRWVLVGLLSIACFFLFALSHEKKATILWVSSLIMIVFIIFGLFAFYDIWAKPSVFIFSLSVVFIVTYIFRLEQVGKLLFFAKEEWENTFNDISDAIVVHDRDFNIVRSNRASGMMLNQEIYGKMKDVWSTWLEQKKSATKNPEAAALELKPCLTEMFEQDISRFVEIKTIPRIDSRNRLAGAIQIVRDITERKKAEKKIKTHLEYLRALRTIDIAITSSLDLQITLDVFLTEVIGQLRVDAADVLLLNPHTRMLEYSLGKGFEKDNLRHEPVKISDDFAGKVAREGKPLIIPSLSNAEVYGRYSELIDEEGIQSYFGMPLVAKGYVNGVLEVFYRQPFEPHEEWLDFLNDLTRQAAIAIDNSLMFVDLQRSHDKIIMAYDATIEGWARALDFRDRETERHSERVAEMAVIIGRELGMSEEELVHMRRGALLHDIGKLGVPDGILRKPGPLSEEEKAIMQKHPRIAYEILSPIEFLKPAIDIPYCHHEKWDGTGYPRKLRGEEIPVAARIFAIVDVWDALCSDRPNRLRWPTEKVREYIRSQAGIHFDPDIVRVFLSMKVH